VKRLLPYTRSIIVSAYGDWKTARDSLKEYEASDFVGKEEGPEALKEVIDKLTQDLHIGDVRPAIIWLDQLSSEKIRDQLFPDDKDIPADQADELICRMFPKAEEVTLQVISDDSASDSSTSERISALRRSSRVFFASIKGERAYQIVKIARTRKIAQERGNYRTYLEKGLRDNRRPVMSADALLWDMGAIAYSYLGMSADGMPGAPQPFSKHYQQKADIALVLRPLQRFFDENNWGEWLKERRYMHCSLFDAYNRSWNNVFSLAKLDQWRTEPEHITFPELRGTFPNPTYWVSQHYQATTFIQAREAITHGDLHGDNLFVDDAHAWPLDFERTEYGPLLRDFVELIQDIVTRLAQIDDLSVLYALVVAICAPTQPNMPMRLPVLVQQHEHASKAFWVVQGLQELAYACTQYEDRREYLWGLLLNNLFAMTLLQDQANLARYRRTQLFASIVCTRLQRLNRAWPPTTWPSIEWALLPNTEPPGLPAAGSIAANNATALNGNASGPMLSGTFTGPVTVHIAHVAEASEEQG
jgi:hypothetical protein